MSRVPEMVVPRGEPEWSPEEKLALAVVEQAVWDVEKGAEGVRHRDGGNVYPTQEDVEDAASFLRDRLWQGDNLWREVLAGYLGGVRSRAHLRQVVGAWA